MLFITLTLMIILCFLLAWDVTIYRLPNQLIITLLALYIPYAWLAALPWMQVSLAVLVSVGLLLMGMAMFALKMIGGGDAKFIAACGLWVGFDHVAEYLLYMALYGGVLTLGILILRPLAARFTTRLWQPEQIPLFLQKRAPVPYGVAISSALLTLIALGKIPGLSLV